MNYCKATIKRLREAIPELQIIPLHRRPSVTYELRLGAKVHHLYIDPTQSIDCTIEKVKSLLGAAR